MGLRNLCFASFLIICYQIPNIFSDNSNELTPASILRYWKSVERRFTLNARKDIVLLMGITGSGKSTLGVLLTEPEMLDVFEDEMTGDLMIVDKKHRISENSTITSKTLVPELMIDEFSGTVFYDCAGFSDTRGVYFDITSAYLLRKLLEYADTVKLVFVADHGYVKTTGDRKNFISLAKHATTLVKDIKKYRNGIALAVTKVIKNNKSIKSGTQVLVRGVVKFLRDTKMELTTMREKNNTSSMDVETNEKITDFIDILLECEDNSKYKKIAIFRLPEEEGSATYIKTMQEDRHATRQIIIDNLQYIKIAGSRDFAYTIAPETKIQILNLLKDISSTWNLLILLDEIQAFYSNEEKFVAKITETHNLLTIGYEYFENIEFTAPKTFLLNLIHCANALNINIPMDNWESYLNNMLSDEVYDILKIVSDDQYSFLFENSVKKFNELKKYIADTKQWYYFVINLHHNFLEVDLADVDELYAQCSIADVEFNISEMTALQNILSQINNNTLDAVYANFSNDSTADSLKLNILKTVLSQTVYNQSFPICLKNDELMVTGNTVKISDVIRNAKCWNEANVIKVFALHRVIIDADIDKIGKNSTIAIIAPKWRVIGKRQINLAGHNGNAHDPPNAMNGRTAKEDGKIGEPGLAGGSGGYFFGIGNQFENDELLEINANGGRGGPGQNGGNGTDGIDGKDVNVESHYYLFDIITLNFVDDKCGGNEGVYERVFSKSLFSKSLFSICYICQFNVTDPGNGGNGGVGGSGGFPGNFTVIGLRKNPEFKLSNSYGDVGSIGSGGIAGRKAKYGKRVILTDIFSPLRNVNDGFVRDEIGITNEYGNDGIDGIDGLNKYKPQKPLVNQMSMSITDLTQSYKDYVRENLIDSLIASKLREFMNALEDNEQIKKRYKIIDFVNEFQSLERQFFRLQSNISFEPFLRSMLQRVNEYKTMNVLSADDQKALTRLNAAMMSKLCAISTKSGVVLNVAKYLKTIELEIGDLAKITKQKNINEHRNEYKSVLDNKIAVGKNFIETQIEPEIEKIFDERREQIDCLTDEIIELRKNVEQNLEEADIAQKRLESLLFYRKVITPLKLVAAAVTFLGPVCAIGGTALGGVTMLFDSYLDRNFNKSTILSPVFGKLLARVTDEYKYRHQSLKSELDELKIDLETLGKVGTPKASYEKLVKEIDETKRDISNITAGITPSTSDAVDKKTKKLQTSISSYVKELKEDSSNGNDKITARLTKFTVIVNGLELGMDSVGRIIGDENKFTAAKDLVDVTKKELEAAEVFEKSIHSVLIPMFNDLEGNVTKDYTNLTGKSQIELDITKWHIKSTLTAVKRSFDKMTEPFKAHNDLLYLFDKLTEALSVLLDIYERFDAYSEQTLFLNYIANIASSGSPNDIDDAKLRDAISNLDELIQTNILWERYQSSIYGIKQHVFPFAERFLAKYELPNSLMRTDDMQEIKRAAVEQIKDLHVKVDSSQALHEVFHNDLIYEDFDENSPFYVWKHDEIKNVIGDLFRGKSVLIKADVRKEPRKRNAVKFKRIEISFNIRNDDANLQNELNDQLDNFGISMVMVGNNYYRCNNKIYSISVDDQIEIFYSIRKDPKNRKPKIKNKTYESIEQNDFFLSPFVLWKITLLNENNDFERLNKFINQTIDLLLVGKGQYLKNGLTSSEICGDNLNRYYDSEKLS